MQTWLWGHLENFLLFCRAFAIRDNYPFWKSRNERSHAGKLFFLDPRDKGTLKIFFDDNIGHTAAHIVDVRDVRTGKLIPFQVRDIQRKNALFPLALKHGYCV